MTDPTIEPTNLDQPDSASPAAQHAVDVPQRPQPQDHLPSRANRAREVDLDLEEFRATLPPLKQPDRLRLRDRNGILDLSIRMNALMKSDHEDEDEDAGTDFDPEDPRTMKLLDLLADFDDYAAEHLATDLEQYVEWASTGNAYEKLGNLLGLYGRAVGESASSSS